MAKLAEMEEKRVEEFERMTERPAHAQARLLSQILHLNAGVEYLARCGFILPTPPHPSDHHHNSDDGDADDDDYEKCEEIVASFRAKVPVVGYEAIKDDLHRIADGDSSPILTSQPVIHFNLSSGTTAGQPKMLPVTPKSLQMLNSAYQLSGIFRKMSFPTSAIPTAVFFAYAGKQFETRGGLKLGSSSANEFRSEAFKKSRWLNCTSPDEVILGNDAQQSMYCHLLCGLIRRERVEFLMSIFAFALVEALRMLEEVWQEICADIRQGILSTRIKDAELRSSVEQLLKPDPELSELIEKECRLQSWTGIIGRLWPMAKFVFTVVTGTMLPYAPALRNYAGKLPIVGIDYIASECFVGYSLDLNASAEDISFVVAPDIAFCEFIPLKKNELELDVLESPTTADYVESDPVGLAEVKLGGIYELVVTTFSGLYRYRLGDVVKVVGFHNATPQIVVYGRKRSVLSVNTDKTDEQELYQVVAKAAMVLKEANVELAHFTSHANLSSRPGHYVIFWELAETKGNLPLEVMERCCSILDTSFNNPYMRGRAAETIGPLELCIVRKGTFGLLQDYALNRGTSPSQYKTPSCITNPDLLTIMREGVVQSCFSPKFPEPVLAAWKPGF